MSNPAAAPRPIDFVVMNCIDHPEIQPEALKPVFKKLTELQPSMYQVENAIAEARKSINQLMEQRAKIAGSFEAYMDLIETGMPAEMVEKYGKEMPKEEANAPNAH